MLTALVPPSYTDDDNVLPHIDPANHYAMTRPYKPAKPSPLSSSPARAPTSPPFTPCDSNARLATQSSPIPAVSTTPSFTSKFALRPSRPNPVTQKREAAQEGRRKLFLKNVRQRAEDKKWEMRGGEQELLKLEWFSLNADLKRAKNSDFQGAILDSDIEDAAGLREEALRNHYPSSIAISEAGVRHKHSENQPDIDDLMVGMFEHDQEQELEALISSMPDEHQTSTHPKPPGPPRWLYDDDDNDDYDALFMDYLSQQQTQMHGNSYDTSSVGHMDLS